MGGGLDSKPACSQHTDGRKQGGGGSLTRMLLQVLVLIVDRGPGLNPYRSFLAEKRGHKGK